MNGAKHFQFFSSEFWFVSKFYKLLKSVAKAVPSNSVDWATAVVGEADSVLTCVTLIYHQPVSQSTKSPRTVLDSASWLTFSWRSPLGCLAVFPREPFWALAMVFVEAGSAQSTVQALGLATWSKESRRVVAWGTEVPEIWKTIGIKRS